jgi:uncharacterized protein
MQYVLISLISFAGAGLTLFSGFGLGTMLVPVFALFFPIEVAIVLTAMVHFANNFFKLFLLGGMANKAIIVRFGIPSVIAAFIGAYVLSKISHIQPIVEYTLFTSTFYISPVKLTIAVLLSFFVLFEVLPSLKKLEFDKKYLPLGGFLSGFFGGLSGNQGALRSAFLMRANLSKEAFIATGVIIACLIDVSRLTIYSKQIISQSSSLNYYLVITATLSAFAGTFIANKLLKKVAIKTVHTIVTIMILLFAILLGMGII